MHGNVLSSDLEPGAQHGGAVAQPAGGVAMRNSQPQPHHILLPNFKQPHALTTLLDPPQTWPEY